MTRKTEKQIEFMRLYEPIHLSFERFCLSLAGQVSLGKDLLNDSILAVFSRFKQEEKIDHFKAYLFRTASNIYYKSMRRSKYFDNETEIENIEMAADEASLEAQTDYYLLLSLLQQLPIEQKEAFSLYELSGFKMAEIAEIQQTSLSSAKQRVHRARKKLQELLKETPYEPQIIAHYE